MCFFFRKLRMKWLLRRTLGHGAANRASPFDWSPVIGTFSVGYRPLQPAAEESVGSGVGKNRP